MAQRILSVVGTAYRGTVEEQDDTILWLTHMLKTGGLDITVLLRSSAVNYAVRDQDASGLRFGDATVEHPPALDADLAGLLDHGIPVLYVEDDAGSLGIDADRMIDGVEGVPMRDVAQLCSGFDQVWHW
jgi:hypothetical protein